MIIVDENGYQAMGRTEDIIELGLIQSKFESFGFEAITIDGHNESDIDNAITQLWASDNKMPKALIAKTVKGKGVHFMENNNNWHYTRLNEKTYRQALLSIDESKE